MKIERFEAIETCLFWREKNILIVGDLHLGYEELLNEQGISVPRIQMEKTIEIFEKILKETGKLKEIILLGDVKHYFGGILKQEFNDVYSLFEFLREFLNEDGKIIITKGNHDNILEPLTKKYGFVELKEMYEIEDILFFHGEEKNLDIYNKKYKLWVIGHYHPAYYLEEDIKKERYKCFLKGKYKKKKIIILPSFFPLIEGTDVRELPFNLKDFEVYVISDKIYNFGRIKTKKFALR